MCDLIDMRALKIVTLILLSLLVISCARVSLNQDDWPTDIPPLAHYVSLYESDLDNQQQQSMQNYLLWVRRFYYGSPLYSRGWFQVIDEVLNTRDLNHDRQQVRESMLAMGKKMSGEWAKDSDSRVIHTRHLMVWGQALRESMFNNEVELLVDKVSRDIDDLLANNLSAESIVAHRYYAQEEDEEEFGFDSEF